MFSTTLITNIGVASGSVLSTNWFVVSTTWSQMGGCGFEFWVETLGCVSNSLCLELSL